MRAKVQTSCKISAVALVVMMSEVIRSSFPTCPTASFRALLDAFHYNFSNACSQNIVAKVINAIRSCKVNGAFAAMIVSRFLNAPTIESKSVNRCGGSAVRTNLKGGWRSSTEEDVTIWLG